jgi:hypothetical protein
MENTPASCHHILMARSRAKPKKRPVKLCTYFTTTRPPMMFAMKAKDLNIMAKPVKHRTRHEIASIQ